MVQSGEIVVFLLTRVYRCRRHDPLPLRQLSHERAFSDYTAEIMRLGKQKKNRFSIDKTLLAFISEYLHVLGVFTRRGFYMILFAIRHVYIYSADIYGPRVT